MKKLSDFKEYTEAQSRHSEHAATLREMKAERANLVEQLHQLLQGANTDARALRLLHGEFIDPSPLRGQIAEIDNELPIRERACELASQQLEKARSEASREICQVERKKFIEPIRQIVTALEAIRNANLRMIEIRSDLEAVGVDTRSIPHALFNAIGTEEDHRLKQSRLAIYVQDIKEQFPEVKK